MYVDKYGNEVDKYGNVIKASDFAKEARPLEPSKRVDAAIESLFTVLREIGNDLKDERYGHSIIQERKQFLERRVTDLEAEIRRLNEKVERYKEGAATNAFRSKEYANLEKRYNTLRESFESTVRKNGLLRDEIKEIKEPDFRTLGDLRSQINLLNIQLSLKDRRIEELQGNNTYLRNANVELVNTNRQLKNQLEKIRDAACD